MSRLVTVARFWDGPEMYAALAALRSAGLHPGAAEFYHAMMVPMLFVGLGGVRMQVPDQEAELAAEIIRRCQSGQGAENHQEAIREANREDGLVCPRCNASEYFRLKSWTFSLAFYLAMGLYVPMTTGRLLCRCCGHKWREAESAA